MPVSVEIQTACDLHPLAERRYGRHGTPRAAPSFVTTRWNRTTIPPRCALLDTARDAP